VPFVIVHSVYGEPGGRYASRDEALAVIDGMVRDGIAEPAEFAVVEVDMDGEVIGKPFQSPTYAIRSLTPRERDVLRLLADGLTNTAIAAELGIAEITVKVYLRHIRDKLGTAAPERSERPAPGGVSSARGAR
jgi:DNA-binding NarL/FixJ family response regulator